MLTSGSLYSDSFFLDLFALFLGLAVILLKKRVKVLFEFASDCDSLSWILASDTLRLFKFA